MLTESKKHSRQTSPNRLDRLKDSPRVRKDVVASMREGHVSYSEKMCHTEDCPHVSTRHVKKVEALPPRELPSEWALKLVSYALSGILGRKV